MALPCPGPAPISLLDIQNEFGGTYLDGTFTQIKEYYRGGGYVANNPTNANIPTSGQISFNQFFCSSGEIIVYITTNTANVVVSSLFGSNWTADVPKRLIITNNAIVYSIYPYALSNIPIGTSPSGTSWLYGYAMKIYEDVGGKFTLQINSGSSIQGAGGRRGGDAIISGETRTNILNGGQGGNALFIGTAYSFNFLPKPIIYIENNGQISAGGGGGGKGGTTYATFTTSGSGPANGDSYNITSQSNGGRGGLGQGYNQNNSPGELETGGGSTGSATFNTFGFGSLQTYVSSGYLARLNRFGIGSTQIFVASGGSTTFNHYGTGSLQIYVSSGGSATINRFGTGSTQLFISSGGSATINRYGTGSIQVTGAGALSVKINNSGSGSIQVTNNGLNYDQTIPVTYATGYFGYVTSAPPSGTNLTVYGGAGGTFGNPGSAGGNGANSSGYPGGSAGYAIDGLSYVSWVTQGTVSGQTQR